MNNKLLLSWILSGFIFIIGGIDEPVLILLCVMSIDWMMGVFTGIVGKSNKTSDGRLSSLAGFNGLLKKAAIILIVCVAYQLERVSGFSGARDVVIVAFICNESLSIIENAGIMGIPIPKSIKNIITALQEKEGGSE